MAVVAFLSQAVHVDVEESRADRQRIVVQRAAHLAAHRETYPVEEAFVRAEMSAVETDFAVVVADDCHAAVAVVGIDGDRMLDVVVAVDVRQSSLTGSLGAA